MKIKRLYRCCVNATDKGLIVQAFTKKEAIEIFAWLLENGGCPCPRSMAMKYSWRLNNSYDARSEKIYS